MITTVDTNVLLDVLIPDAPHGDECERALAGAAGGGALGPEKRSTGREDLKPGPQRRPATARSSSASRSTLT